MSKYSERYGARPLPDMVTMLERHLITEAMRVTNNCVSKAAKELGVSRRTLHYKLQQLGLRDYTPRPSRARSDAERAEPNARMSTQD